MKKAIIASLAVVGGITLVTTAIVSAWAAVEAAKDRKRLAEMTPEERENERVRRATLLNALLAAYGKKSGEEPDREVISVEVF